MAALNYKEKIEFTYDKYIVTPSIAFATIAKPAGTYTVKTLILEWYGAPDLQGLITSEFPEAQGWVYSMPQPSKVMEELDLLSCTITGTKRSA